MDATLAVTAGMPRASFSPVSESPRWVCLLATLLMPHRRHSSWLHGKREDNANNITKLYLAL